MAIKFNFLFFRREVPRMLMNANQMELLENYIEEKKEPELYKWWAQYSESQGKFDLALKYYKLADDMSSLVGKEEILFKN